MRIKIIIKKLKRNLNDFGAWVTLGKCLRYPFKKFYTKTTYRVYRRDLGGEKFPEPCTDGIVLRVVEKDNTQALRQIWDMEEWLDAEFQNFISQWFCVAAFDGPRVVGFNLVALQEMAVPSLKLKVRLLSKEAWSEQITVLKAYRRRGLATALSYRVFAKLQEQGVRTFYSGTTVLNIPSLKYHEKVGFRFIADVQYLKVFNRERRTWKRARHVGH